jgi:hypothetical protein
MPPGHPDCHRRANDTVRRKEIQEGVRRQVPLLTRRSVRRPAAIGSPDRNSSAVVMAALLHLPGGAFLLVKPCERPTMACVRPSASCVFSV